MSEKHRQLIGIPDEHELKHTGSKSENRRGQDADLDYYDEIDPNGQVVAKYEVRDSMSIYPPQKRSVSFTKVG